MAPLASPIRWQVLYKDVEGKVVREGPYSSTNPAVKEDPVEPNDSGPTSVFDIIIHVTVRDLIKTKAINTEEEAAEVGAESVNGEVKVEDVIGEQKNHPYKISKVNSSVMVIRSQALIKAFQSVVKYYPKQAITGDKITVDEPYYFVLHHLNDLEKHVDKTEAMSAAPNKDSNSDINGVIYGAATDTLRHDFHVLKSYLEPKWGKKIQSELQRHKQVPPVATYEMLWMLFKPGVKVFAFSGDTLWNGGWIVRGFKSISSEAYKISLWKLDFDGRDLDRGKQRAIIVHFDGEREIYTLDPYPVELRVGDKSISLNRSYEEKLIKRGEKFIGYVKTILDKNSLEVTYNGEVFGDGKLKNYDGNAILDPFSYRLSSVSDTSSGFNTYFRFSDNDEAEPGSTLETSNETKPWDNYQNISAKTMKECPTKFDDGHFFLCPPTMGGFLTRRREFSRMSIDAISPYSVDKEILRSLQIPEAHMKLITALTHRFDDGEKTWSADNIHSKGEGLIFLLHGPSGVGKTYTAECIALYSGRPLLSLTVADIGTDEAEMEKQLAKWFSFSETWGAIMLIDEADVYFERRASGQLQRNSLVSAFLRSMEYYRGILFLTTNRLGHIDDAIISRIHLIIEYKDLTPEDRKKIWKQFFLKLTKDRKNYTVDDYVEGFVENDDKILNLKWNGREIRNAFQTAVALAEYDAKTATPPKEKVVVSRRHLEGVAEMSAVFKQYMKEWKGGADKRAYIEGARMDEAIRHKKSQLDIARKAARESRGQ